MGNNINIMERFSDGKLKKKYSFNENYFDSIDTIDKAYFLGLFAADGYNNVKKRRVVLQLQAVDKNIIDSFKEKLQSNHKLYHLISKRKNESDCYCLNLGSKHMCSKISFLLGCENNKSSNLQFPAIDDNLLSHFLRRIF